MCGGAGGVSGGAGSGGYTGDAGATTWSPGSPLLTADEINGMSMQDLTTYLKSIVEKPSKDDNEKTEKKEAIKNIIDNLDPSNFTQDELQQFIADTTTAINGSDLSDADKQSLLDLLNGKITTN